MSREHDAMLERLKAYEERFRLILGMNGLDGEIALGSFPAISYDVRRVDDKFQIENLQLPNGMLIPLIDVDVNNFVVALPKARKSTALISIAKPSLTLLRESFLLPADCYDLYNDIAEVSDDVLDWVVAHEVGHYLYREKRVPGKVKYVLRTRGGLRDSSHAHAGIDIIGSYVVSSRAILSALEYLKSHDPESVDLDVRIKQVELYGLN